LRFLLDIESFSKVRTVARYIPPRPKENARIFERLIFSWTALSVT
jgi:hypothetical protein